MSSIQTTSLTPAQIFNTHNVQKRERKRDPRLYMGTESRQITEPTHQHSLVSPSLATQLEIPQAMDAIVDFPETHVGAPHFVVHSHPASVLFVFVGL